MQITKTELENETYLTQSSLYGEYLGGAALCVDSKVRKLSRIAAIPDTFFSIPASVKVSGKTVAGFVMIEDDTLKFFANREGANSSLLHA